MAPITDVVQGLQVLQNSLDRIERRFMAFQRTAYFQWRIVMSELDTLEAAVAADTDVVSSAVTLLTTLHDELAAAIAANDPVRIQAVADHLAANTQVLADAVVANTPAAP